MPGQIADAERALYLLIRALAALCIIGIWFGWTGAVAQSSSITLRRRKSPVGPARSSGKSR